MGFVRATITVALLSLCACASVPMASAERDLAAKKFEVSPDEAHLYVYRDETFGAGVKLPVLLDGRHAGDTGPHTFLLVPVAAGPHLVISKSEVDSELRFTAENGKAYFVWQEVKFGLFSPRSELHVMNGKEGRAAVGTCSLIEAPPGQPAAALAPAALAVAVDAQGFPRVLSGAEIAAHFGRHPSVDARLGRQTFKLTVQSDNSVERSCPGCTVTQASGSMKLDGDRVCFQWTRVRFPDSGCYQLVQTAADQFTLRGVDQQRPISYSARE
jgi:hypothetical protein